MPVHVFCSPSQFEMLMFENTKARFKRKWKKNKTIHMHICYWDVYILVPRVLKGIFIVYPLIITEFMFVNKVKTKVSSLYLLNFPHTGIIESEILMKY